MPITLIQIMHISIAKFQGNKNNKYIAISVKYNRTQINTKYKIFSEWAILHNTGENNNKI